jgi:hypothetical protein
MKKILFFLLSYLLLSFCNLKGQQITFEFSLSTSNDIRITDIIEDHNGDFLLAVKNSNLSNPHQSYGSIFKMDKNGFLIDSVSYALPGKSVYFTDITSFDNNFYELIGVFHDANAEQRNAGFIHLKISQKMDIAELKTHAIPEDFQINLCNGSKNTKNNTLIFGSYSTSSSITRRPYICEFNGNFEIVVENYYFELGYGGMINQISDLPDGNYWAIRLGQVQYDFYDSVFNLIDHYPLPVFMTGHIRAKWDTDTSFFLVGKGMYPPPMHNISFVRQFHAFDTAGFLFNEWQPSDTVDYPGVKSGIDYRHKDSVVFGGSRNVDIYNSPYSNKPSWFILIQTDSLLNIRWERFYGGDAHYILQKIIATRDGGYLMAGYLYDYFNTTEERTDIVVIKLNEEGLLVGQQDLQLKRMQEAIVYPNPGDKLNVRVGKQHEKWIFSLYDLNGRLLLQRTSKRLDEGIDVSSISVGTYIYKITNTNGLYESGKWIKKQ